MDGCNDGEMHNWREWVKAKRVQYYKTHGDNTFGGAVKVFDTKDPTDRDYTGVDWKTLYNDPAMVNKIVEDDLFDIMQCDVLLANYYPTKRCIGTIMEVKHAWDHGKLVVVNYADGKDDTISPWFSYFSHRITFNLEEAMEFILEKMK